MNKVFLPLAGRRIISWSLEALARISNITQIVLAVRPQERTLVRRVLDRELPDLDILIVDGGESRHQSEYNALHALENSGIEVDVVVIHDGARPLLSAEMVSRLIGVAYAVGGAVPALPPEHLALFEGEGLIDPLVEDAAPVRVQTPQAFQAKYVFAAYRAAAQRGFVGTDTASCVEKFTRAVIQTIPGDDRNIKITYPEDLFMVERILATNHYIIR